MLFSSKILHMMFCTLCGMLVVLYKNIWYNFFRIEKSNRFKITDSSRYIAPDDCLKCLRSHTFRV